MNDLDSRFTGLRIMKGAVEIVRVNEETNVVFMMLHLVATHEEMACHKHGKLINWMANRAIRYLIDEGYIEETRQWDYETRVVLHGPISNN